MANIEVALSVRQSFDSQRRVADLLKTEFDRLLERRPREWHVTSRVKSFDSFVEKLQTGRFHDQDHMEDFFAATVVVPNRSALVGAEGWLSEVLVVDSRRPSAGPTRISASDFRFDDLRLYGTLRPAPGLPRGPIHEMLFEVQVKTFLQHAWGVATHDTVYKTDRSSWTRNRMAYQIRALLEHAEAAADAIAAYESAALNPVVGENEARVQLVIELIGSRWNPDFLPSSLVRAGENIDSLARELGISTSQFVSDVEGELGDDEPPLGWSPYQFAVHVASRRYPSKFAHLLKKTGAKARVYYVTADILRSLGLSEESAPSARL